TRNGTEYGCLLREKNHFRDADGDGVFARAAPLGVSQHVGRPLEPLDNVRPSRARSDVEERPSCEQVGPIDLAAVTYGYHGVLSNIYDFANTVPIRTKQPKLRIAIARQSFRPWEHRQPIFLRDLFCLIRQDSDRKRLPDTDVKHRYP